MLATVVAVGHDARMRRADRLFLIIHALQGRRSALPARELASTLDVSLRTIYRDVADLQVSGVPIEGEAGVGYMLRKGSDIPPLMFTAEELEALVVGSRFVRAFAGRRLASAAQAAMLKIEAVLPPELQERAAHTRIFAPTWDDACNDSYRITIDDLNAAIGTRQVLRVVYFDEAGRESRREVEPLCLAFWGSQWTLGSWCRLRQGFRNFRPDRMHACQSTGEIFDDHPERNLPAFLSAVRQGTMNLGGR